MAEIYSTQRHIVVEEGYVEIAQALIYSPNNDFIEVTEVIRWSSEIPPYSRYEDKRKVLLQKAHIVEILDDIKRKVEK
jgi:hypothetical protein